MNTVAPVSKDINALADVLRPALLRASRALRREAQRAGASALDAQLLGVIKKNGGIGVSELADREQMTRASMSGHVKRLERAGWIERAVGEDADKRRVDLPFLEGKSVHGADYLVEMAQPNFFFHLVHAYAILRHNGVTLGKMQFIGSLKTFDR